MKDLKKVLCLMCSTLLLYSFVLKHPLFNELIMKGELCLTAENQHQFLSLQESLIERLKSLSKTKMHDVHELIHCKSFSSFKVTSGALSTIFTLDQSLDSGALHTKLSCKEIDPQFSGRTYFLYNNHGSLQALSFQEEGPCCCKKITFGILEHQTVRKNITAVLDYLLEHDESFLALPYVKMTAT
jgi:hypothetical protein